MEEVRSGTDREAGLGHGRGRAKQDARAESTNSRRFRRCMEQMPRRESSHQNGDVLKSSVMRDKESGHMATEMPPPETLFRTDRKSIPRRNVKYALCPCAVHF